MSEFTKADGALMLKLAVAAALSHTTPRVKEEDNVQCTPAESDSTKEVGV